MPERREVFFTSTPLTSILRKAISTVRKCKKWPPEATQHWVLVIGSDYVCQLLIQEGSKVVQESCGPLVHDSAWAGWKNMMPIGYTNLSNAQIEIEAKMVIERMKPQYHRKKNNCQVFVAHLLSLVIDTREDADMFRTCMFGHYTREVKSTIVRLSERKPRPTDLSETPSHANKRRPDGKKCANQPADKVEPFRRRCMAMRKPKK